MDAKTIATETMAALEQGHYRAVNDPARLPKTFAAFAQQFADEM